MIASTAPATSKEVKQPTVSNAPPLAYLQGGGQLSGYTFSSGPYAGMTVGQVQQMMQGYSQQTQQQFGPKKPDTVTGSSSTDQALGYVGGLGATAGAAYLANGGLASSAPVVAQTGGQVAGQVGGQVASQGIGQALSTGGQVAAQGGSQGVGTAINGGTMLADGTVQGGSSVLGQYAGQALPYLGLAANAYQIGNEGYEGYQRGEGKQFGDAIQQEASHQVSPALAATAAINPYMWFWGAQAALGGAGAGSLFGSSKAPERMARKEARRSMQNAGLMNEDSRSRYNLADGSQYDIREAPDKKAYNVNWDGEDARRGEDVGITNALANALIGGGNKVSRDSSGELFNAWRSNGQFDANAKASFDKVGGRNAVYEAVANRWKEAKDRGDDTYTADQRDADFASIDRLYGIKNETGARWEDSQNLSDKDKQRNSEQLAKANGGKPQSASSVSPQATTKPLPVQAQAVDRNGGRPATPVNVNYRPSADKNPKFKGKKK